MKRNHDSRHHVSRRSFLRGATALSLGAIAGHRIAPATIHAAEAPATTHGTPLRGMFLSSKDRLAEGRFGVMFKKLSAFAPRDELLIELGKKMEEKKLQNDADHLNTNPRLFAGFTFLGQFIDHDITFDNTPLELQQLDPDAQTNFRTPRYDLDSMYGHGPTGSPELYDQADPDKFLLITKTVQDENGSITKQWEDVPRNTDGIAIIPEPRNDENLIIIQLHIAFMKFHNRLVDYVRSQGMRREWVFEAARRLARWYYQWMVIHDFVPRFVGDSLFGQVYKEQAGKPPVITLNYYKPTNKEDRPFMPVEFAVAVYRFGHSLVRPAYIINDETANGVSIFGTPDGFNLNGGRPIPSNLVVEWKNILPVDGGGRPPRKIDTQLSPPLFSLPDSVIPPPDPERLLAVRNNLRGKQVGLPSGQQIAKAMRVTALTNKQLGLTDSQWNNEAPLWYYILKEAELLHKGEQLGPVGGRIMAEVLVGLLQRDKNSYLYLDASWKPSPPIAPATGQFTLVDLLKYAGAA